MFSVLFPGQGSQSVGMGKELYDRYSRVKEIFRTVDETLGYSLSNIIFNGNDSELRLTKHTQPAIMTIGISIFSILKEEFNVNLNKAKFFAGHSLGEYTALVCANSIDLKTAAFLLHERGKAMQNAVPPGEGAMLAILGMSINEVLEEIKSIEKNGVCEIANDNSPNQVVVSGNKIGIEQLSTILKNKSKKGIILPVSAPFHCSLMKKASLVMSQKIQEAIFTPPTPSIITNVKAREENNVTMIKDLLIKQITSRVRWTESIEYMVKSGVDEFIEIGPGKVLSGLVKRINKNVKIVSLNSVDDIKNYLNK